jgi:NADH-quinone oxidoreductase subunit J
VNDILLALFGVAALVCALLVVVLRQPMRSALALIAHMVSLAGVFACLEVHIIALFQVLIYVGAVMVFMVYAIMLLDDRDISYTHVFARWSIPALVAMALIVGALGALLASALPAVTAAAASFGFAAFSVDFMTRYWFHFELVTLLLVIGVVAAWVVIAEPR